MDQQNGTWQARYLGGRAREQSISAVPLNY